jgi:hypothetical protein
MSSKRRERPTFFVDIDLGPHFFATLSRDGRFGVEFHDDHFTMGTDDSEWLSLIAGKGWIGVTHDKKIRRDHRPIIAQFGVRVIVVVGRRPVIEQADNFRATYPRIERFVNDTPAPYIAKLFHPTPAQAKRLKPTGRIEKWGHW